ncbi:hypothetical protein PBT90_19985 [Algoriphagus halophytocola]|uniref:hypothetical protein n=1 Tax=Algoriphagus halophytocola TaxID=2991499 RepID=UPI0022DE6CB5|nr:hypothetical protein [Algoriphagus sp. TR-M9]WBL43010.1 hypothetical protein PBT90_19985 [Algoriphagus sp. TR-M9]
MDSSLTIVTIVYIIMLVIPGVFFKRIYFQGPFTRQFQSGLFADRLITSLFWGILVQIVTFYIFINTFNVQYESIFELLTETHSKLTNNEVPDFNESGLTNILLYLLGSVIIALFLGFFAFHFVRIFQLDQRFAVLRFANKWHYYFSGEILNSREFKQKSFKRGKVATTLIDVLVKYGEDDNRLFSGSLVQYSITSEGNLNTIYLTGTRRYKNSKGDAISPKEIPGDCFVIPYQNVLDMNVQYILKKSEKGKTRIKIKTWAVTGINFILFILLPSFFIYPWFSDTSILSKVLSILSLLISWVFLAVLIAQLTQPQKNSKNGNGLDKKDLVYVILVFLLFGTIGLSFLNVIDPIGYIFK